MSIKNNYPKILVLATVLTIGIFNFSSAATQVTYPVAELGNCASAKACKTYCDKLEHMEACVDFGKAHGLLTDAQAQAASKFTALKLGPGGCADKDACKVYCTDTAHTDECVKFATDHKLAPPAELEKFRKFQEAVKTSTTPGDCNSPDACEKYCADAANADVCIKFAEDKGLIEKQRAVEVRKLQEEMKLKENTNPTTTFQVPSTIRDCILKNYSQELLDQILAAKTTVGLKDKIPLCVTTTPPAKPTPTPTPNPTGTNSGTSFQLPPAIRDCAIKNYGEAFVKLIENSGTTAGLKDKIPLCLQPPPSTGGSGSGQPGALNKIVPEPFKSDQ